MTRASELVHNQLYPLIHVKGKAKRTNVNEMWCNRVVIMFDYQKGLKEYSTLDIDGVDLISFEELV